MTGPAYAITGALVWAAEKGPEPEDVKAGWTAFAIFLLLALAVALLGWSLVRQLRKADAARAAGVYGDPPADASTVESSTVDEPSRPNDAGRP